MATATTRRKALPLDAASRTATAEQLQGVLYNLIALRLGVQQVHWNLHGPRFFSIHTMLGEFYVALDAQIDVLAERILALGTAADGRPDAVAEHTTLPASDEGFVTVETGTDRLLAQYAAFDTHAEDARAEIEDLDAVSHDLLVGLLELSQKQQWMLRAHLA